MKISIVLPGFTAAPIGGYHVHFAYANALQSYGHSVTLIFPRKTIGPFGLADHIKAPLWKLKTLCENRPLITSFPIDKQVKVILVDDLSARKLPNADIIIATGWQTAEAMSITHQRSGKKFYVVYDYEFFMTADPFVRDRIALTYASNFIIVATSEVVRTTVERAGGKVAADIICGIDFKSFGMDTSPEHRIPFTLGFPLREGSYKGGADAIAAALTLKERHGNRLAVTAFGTNRLDLPDWITWLQYPSQAELRAFYNQQSVFLLPSHFEGWGLPAVEAMACGAALVTADNGGSRDYAFHEETALVTLRQRPDLLAQAVDRLFQDTPLRLKLAYAANQFVQKFTWESAARQLESLLIEKAATPEASPIQLPRN